ncbi:MAG: hypothetical protein ACU0CT_02575 [Paracoccaceae bacterium]|jgi:hypothetical protein
MSAPVTNGGAAVPPPHSAPASGSSSQPGASISPTEQAHKLTLIARQTADELRGWYGAVFVHRFRSPFPGELEAIKRRADQLGLTFKG